MADFTNTELALLYVGNLVLLNPNKLLGANHAAR